MTFVRTISPTPVVTLSRRSRLQPARLNPSLIAALAVFFAVLIADVALIALAAPSVSDLASIYAVTD